jgi:NAD(P)-dependent dehydrogenase (short-subunit alcohol dehydrogenase family)
VGDASHVLALVADVSDAQRMEDVAAEVGERFGAVHLLCNNAGVSITGPVWTMTTQDADWLFGVNLFGVLNGLRAFVPGMIDHGADAHVVNTASLAGLVPMADSGLYSGAKAAVIAMSEVLSYDLADVGAGRVGVSVLCPSLVNTNIMSSERNRPTELAGEGAPELPDWVRVAFNAADDPLEVADAVFTAVERNDFYVLTSPEGRIDITSRMEAIADLHAPARPRPGAAAPTRGLQGVPDGAMPGSSD